MSGTRFRPIRRNCKVNQVSNDAKICMIRALYFMVFNAEESLIPLSVELFHLIGNILEGTPPEYLPFHNVSKDTFLATYNDLVNREKGKV